MLNVTNLTKRFGNTTAVHDVSLRFDPEKFSDLSVKMVPERPRPSACY